MAPGLLEQKFGTMWPTVAFRAIIWAILSFIGVNEPPNLVNYREKFAVKR